MEGEDRPEDHREAERLFVSHQDGGPEVVVSGELDMARALALEECLRRLAGTGEGDVRIDMSAVVFLGSTAVRVLADAHRRLEDDGRRLVLRNVDGMPRRTMAVVGLLDVLHLE